MGQPCYSSGLLGSGPVVVSWGHGGGGQHGGWLVLLSDEEDCVECGGALYRWHYGLSCPISIG